MKDENELVIREPQEALEFPKVNIVIDGEPLVYLMESRRDRCFVNSMDGKE